jgi:N-acyl-D-amino-acid deacylase
MFDLVIKNGYLVDPSVRIQSKLNIGVKDGKVALVTVDGIAGSAEIDAGGLIVAPGFIDMHIHEDLYDEENDRFQILISETMLKMGVATVIGGNCGKGYIDDPLRYLSIVDRLGYPVNIGMLAPHERIRAAFGEFDNYAPMDRKYLNGMKDLLKTWLDGGCFGLSMGIEYDPGIDEAEAAALMEIAAKSGKIVTAHQRSDGNKAIAAIKEYIAWGEAVGAKLHISHLSSMNSFGQMEESLSIIDGSRAKGVDIGFDGYPYYAFCTWLGSAVFDDGFLDKYNYDESGYGLLQVASGPSAGIRLNKETFFELRVKEPRTLIIAHVLNEREVDLCISHPDCIVVSDGLYSNGQGHPRGAGTFPKLIRDYVTEKKQMTLFDAIEKITWMPAQRMGLSGKGSLKAGSDADITIFDLNTIRDEATYQESTKPPKGIEYVVINGKIALAGGEVVNGRLGRAIRK